VWTDNVKAITFQQTITFCNYRRDGVHVSSNNNFRFVWSGTQTLRPAEDVCTVTCHYGKTPSGYLQPEQLLISFIAFGNKPLSLLS
jgi:hypothetical protein